MPKNPENGLATSYHDPMARAAGASSDVPDVLRLARSSVRRRRTVIAAGVLVFLAGSAFAVSRKGLFISQDTVFAWLLAGLLALSLTDIGRWGRGMLVDWLPLGLLLLFYDTSRGVSGWLGIPIHSQLQIHADQLLFGRRLVPVALQQLLHRGDAVAPWDYPLFAVYMTHFFMALLVAGTLWRLAYPRFRQFRNRLVALNGLGFLTYVLYPAQPPWMASQAHGHPRIIHRVIVQTWNHVGLHTANTVFEQGSAFYNQVAAVPSMHAAITLLILLFFWRGAPAWVRVLLVTYVLAMAFALVYSGEHYVFDILLGWLYAGAVVGGAAVLRAARSRQPQRRSLTWRAPRLRASAGLAKPGLSALTRASALEPAPPLGASSERGAVPPPGAVSFTVASSAPGGASGSASAEATAAGLEADSARRVAQTSS